MDQQSANIAAFMKFAKAWEALDLDGIISAFTPDAIYHNQPTDPVRGHDAIRATLRPWLEGTTKMTWEIHNIAETPSGAVLAERTDSFVMNGHAVALPVTGAFEFKDGLITAWRDYYDQATVTRQMAGA
jgi:limonene-1,2-epoxide hydrolase